MRWLKWETDKAAGDPPSPRSGHTAVLVGGSYLVVFGGLLEKRFLGDVVVLDTENRLWFQPPCSAQGMENGGPCARAFHCAAAMEHNMFVFGGRSGRRRLDDFWVLDTETWQWTKLEGFGSRPPPRDFAAAAALPSAGKLVVVGGWDGRVWHADAFVLDIVTLEWTLVQTQGGQVPAPRCGHTATVVETRVLIFGGRSGAGGYLGDLWALKGMFGEAEPPGWTRLVLGGSAPAARCGHTMAASGTQVLLFGGHGAGGWLTRYDVYFNDVIILDRKSVEWKHAPVEPEPGPSPRAYHSMTAVGGGRMLLFGGWDGKAAVADVWWLLPEGDPLIQPKPPIDAPSGSLLDASSSPPQTEPPPHSRALSVPGAVSDSAAAMVSLRLQLGLSPSRPEPASMAVAAGEAAEVHLALAAVGRRVAGVGPGRGDDLVAVPGAGAAGGEDLVAKTNTGVGAREGGKGFVEGDFAAEGQNEEVSGRKHDEGVAGTASGSGNVGDTGRGDSVGSGQRAEGDVDEKKAGSLMEDDVRRGREYLASSSLADIQIAELEVVLKDYQRLVTQLKLGLEDHVSGQIDGVRFAQSLQGGGPWPAQLPVWRFRHVRTHWDLRVDDVPGLMEEYRKLLVETVWKK